MNTRLIQIRGYIMNNVNNTNSNSYEIITDSAANLTNKLVAEDDIKMIPLKYVICDEEFDSYIENNDDDTIIKDFYAKLRNKESVTTSCVNKTYCTEYLENILQQGKDFIYLAFSSGLSATYNIALSVIESLKEKYPERKMYVADTLAASFGQGLLVDYAAQKRKDGMSIDELYKWHEENKFHLCHWFTVDDLFFLKRGGRVSATTAIAGTLLGIKPVMHVDNDGHLINVDKTRGRKQSLIELVNRMEKTAINPKDQRVFIGHGDCYEEALFVRDLVKERFGVKDFEITYINPIIGAHSGPGTMALFFMGKER